MVNVQFYEPGEPIPDMGCEGTRYFSSTTRKEILKQMEDRARQRNRRFFIATEKEQSIAFGLTKVRTVLSIDNDEIRLAGSHARHRRRTDAPLEVGRSYEVAIDPGSNAILAAEPNEDQAIAGEEEPTERFPINPSVDLRSLSRDDAQAFFSRLQRQPHIPFQYPANGCWARAHEMCRLIEHYLHADPADVVAKVWNDGDLVIRSSNSPDCEVEWDYHVAPVVRVEEELLVLDPALFEEPVKIEKWRLAQMDNGAETAFTSWRAYDFRKRWAFVAATPEKTERDLEEFRRDLINQIYCRGPLPYHCSIDLLADETPPIPGP